MERKSYLPHIDGLRAIAVMAVVLFHFGFGFPGGYVGVDVFFVISGFLITGILARQIEAGTFSYGGFLYRRMRRLMPSMLIVTGVTMAAALMIMIPSDRADAARSAIASLFYIANWHFFRDIGYFNEAATTKPFLHMWSLAVEEQFYLVMPIGLLLLHRLGAWPHRLAIIASLLLLSFAAAAFFMTVSANAVFYLLPFRAWEFGVGAFLALMPKGRFPRLPPFAMSCAGLALILSSTFLYTEETAFPGVAAAPPVVGTALLLAFGGSGRNLLRSWLEARPMLFVGKISYSLYLWHWPILVFVGYGSFESQTAMPRLLGVALAIILAWLTTVRFERPIREAALLKGPQRFAAATVAALVFLTTAGYLTASRPYMIGRPMENLALVLGGAVAPRADASCNRSSIEQVEGRDLCVLGVPYAKPRFILLGDSHARSLSSALNVAAEMTEVSGFQVTGPSLNVLPNADIGSKVGGRELLETLALLAREEEISLVIVHAYWLRYAEGPTYRNGHLPLRPHTGDPKSPRKDVVTSGLVELATLFPNADILLVGDVPSGKELHRPNLARAQAVPWYQRAGILPNEERLRQRQTTEHMLIKAAATHPRVHYLPLEDLYCIEGSGCPIRDESGFLYHDGDHLSIHGSLRAVPRITGAIAALLCGEGECSAAETAD
ncbi:MAG: acyltransferase family protein [Parvularcula sp.]|jgi:peptidoglycan/LPS O-acetylase OafA/YrhL|nr:acyltransferase family protein [Parvularcula sp.]